jgi:hypothetical protein
MMSSVDDPPIRCCDIVDVGQKSTMIYEIPGAPRSPDEDVLHNHDDHTAIRYVHTLRIFKSVTIKLEEGEQQVPGF